MLRVCPIEVKAYGNAQDLVAISAATVSTKTPSRRQVSLPWQPHALVHGVRLSHRNVWLRYIEMTKNSFFPLLNRPCSQDGLWRLRETQKDIRIKGARKVFFSL